MPNNLLLASQRPRTFWNRSTTRPMTMPIKSISFAIAIAYCMAFGVSSSTAQSPAIEAVLELPRSEPRHYVEAILSLVDLERPDLAQPIADEFAALKLTDAQQIGLLEQVGTARLSRMAKLLPSTAGQVNQCLTTVNREQNDPEKINQLLADIGFGTPVEQQAAYRAIRRTGIVGVELSLDAIRVAKNPKAEARLREALVVLEPTSIPFLMAATADPSEAVRTQAAYALGRLAELDLLTSPLAAALLAKNALYEPADSAFGGAARWSYNQLRGRPINDREAGQLLKQTIDSLLEGPPPFAADELGQVAWQANRDLPVSRYDVRTVSLALASRLAVDRLAFEPLDRDIQQKALLLCLEAGALAPTDRPTLDEFSSEDVSRCLAKSLSDSMPKGAIACCETLGKRRDSSVLYATGGQTSPLAMAVSGAHAAVRFAALKAIMNIKPTEPYAGSSHVVEALIYFSAGNGERVVVVAMPQIARSADLASVLRGNEYRALAFNQGADVVKAVENMPDVECILLDLDLIQPAVRETLYRLRRTPGGGNKPVALLAPAGELLEASEIAEEHRAAGSMVIAFSRPTTDQAIETLLGRIDRLEVVGVSDLATRQTQATEARQWISQLLSEGPAFYRVQNKRQALELMLNDPTDLTTNEALSRLATPTSQLRLANRASLRSLPLEARQSAAIAFRESVERNGILLTANQIMDQYDRYNASQTADTATQEVLGSLLDTLEAARQ